MGTVARIHYWNIVNDDTMDARMIRELIDMLNEYVDEVEKS